MPCNVRRAFMVPVFLFPLAFAGCETTEEDRHAAEAARISEEAHDDDRICRTAGFPPGSDSYRFCRKERMLTR